MAGAAMGDGDEAVSVNVTPLIDVIFCLCLFFMCSFHFKQLEGTLSSWLPKDAGPRDVPAQSIPLVDGIRISVTLEPSSNRVVLRFGSREVRDLDELEGLVVSGYEEQKARAPDARVVIDGERRVPWRSIVGVLDPCRKRGIDNVELAQAMPERRG
jgi:biopolymer transport protein ExbD